jgi:hypothetical protein
MSEQTEGWAFTDSNALDWTTIGEGLAMKPLGEADGKLMMMFKFDAGYVMESSHQHVDAEFTYILDGEVTMNGVMMKAGHSYAAGAGTTHEEVRTNIGATLISVFPNPREN